MRLILVILVFFSGTVLSRYYEKRRFDRSVYDDFETPNIKKYLIKTQWTFTDYETHFKAYKDKEEYNCYIEKLGNDVATRDRSKNEIIQQKQTPKILYASNEPLTQLEAWQVAGARIVDFCNERKIILLQRTAPIPEQIIDPFFEIFPLDENDVVTKRVADVVLTPLISRAKRQIVLEERQKLNRNFEQNRLRRQIQQAPGKFRGQTQSQYLSISNNEQKEGKAEAEATQQSSRAVVSGNYGMGQAQSMSLGGIGCEDCPKYGSENTPDRYIQVSAIKQPGDSTGHSDMIAPGMSTTYPSRVSDSTARDHTPYLSNIYGTSDSPVYHGALPNTPIRGATLYSGSVGDTTGNGAPNAGSADGTPDSGTVYPGSISGTTINGDVPHSRNVGGMTGSNAIYPGGIPSSITGGSIVYPSGVVRTTTNGVIYPETVPGTATRENIPYPGTAPGALTGGNVPYSGTAPAAITGKIIPYPGTVPSSTTGGEVVYPGGIPTATTGGNIIYPGTSPDTATRGNILYSGTVPATITSGRVVYSGGIPSTTTVGGVDYPKGVSSTPPRGSVSYPATTTGTTPGVGILYPGSVSRVVPATREIAPYPGAVPSPTIDSTSYSESISGAVGSGVMYPGGIPVTRTDGIPYPRGIPGTTISDSTSYPGSIPVASGGTVTSNGLIYPDSTQSSLPNDRVGTYTGSIIPETRETARGQIVTNSKVVTDTKVYPNGQIPTTQFFGERPYLASRESDIKGGVYRNTGSPETSTSGRTSGIIPDTKRIYNSGITSPSDQLRETIHYPEEIISNRATDRSIVPGMSITVPNSSVTYSRGTVPTTTGHFVTGDHVSYTKPNAGVDGTRVQMGSNNIHLQKIETGQPGISYSHGTMRYPGDSTRQVSEVGKYPDSQTVVPTGHPLQGQYPSSSTWHDRGTSTSLTGNRQEVEQYPSQKQGIGQYPLVQYPSNLGFITNTGETHQYHQQPNNILPVEDDNSNSQASSSVKQTNSGTHASASAQGIFRQGTAQSQVTGTYSGSGSFSAQAGSTDINKSAQTEINGGKEGAVSNAQGVGGYGKSQTQVQLNSESGATATGAQSSGWNHGTNSQVQASSKGGMADAQANGEGSTSSQAQIGFQPYLNMDEKIEKHSKPFHGGGTASAQSGAYTGQSQSQLEGSFQYGITYTGAAQAGSGSGASASRKPFNFNLTDTELFKSFKPSYRPQIVQKNNSEVVNTSSDTDYEYNQDKSQQGLQTSSSSQRRVITKPTNDNSRNVASKPNQSLEKSQVDDTLYDYEEEYDGEDYDTPIQTSINSKISKIYTTDQNNSNRQSPIIHDVTEKQYDIHVKQDTNTAQVGDVLQPGQSLSGYTIPPGFRGRVTAIAGDETIVHGNGKSKSQTVSLIPKESGMIYENKSPISEIRSLKTNHERLMEGLVSSKEKQNKNLPLIQNQTSMEYSKPSSNISMKPSYYTVTNSIAGKMDDRNSPRKYEHRYYTKSSTCGYFTFSCNIVYGSNGRTKICKPKVPTHPDGTPMRC
ncbi:PREDICTED: mucin-5AC-like [Eufriesea mexicana]|uniref:mucin-5AC-like n=1 Tax=Eufriesea mexicana TaxID=516756 RepID=UPI00083C2B40|nr:PREDICTED: mucin-5AC-like [Eufriesea mexicana]